MGATGQVIVNHTWDHHNLGYMTAVTVQDESRLATAAPVKDGARSGRRAAATRLTAPPVRSIRPWTSRAGGQARDDGRPTRFVWRGRLYTVHAILEHWVISRETRRDCPEAGPGQPDLEFWRVEAAPGPGTTARVCELRRKAATNAWTLRLGSG